MELVAPKMAIRMVCATSLAAAGPMIAETAVAATRSECNAVGAKRGQVGKIGKEIEGDQRCRRYVFAPFVTFVV